jgi:hypothetical protein
MSEEINPFAITARFTVSDIRNLSVRQREVLYQLINMGTMQPVSEDLTVGEMSITVEDVQAPFVVMHTLLTTYDAIRGLLDIPELEYHIEFTLVERSRA